MKTFLTIDWDFFFDYRDPTHPGWLYDWGYKDTPMFKDEFIWHERVAHNRDILNSFVPRSYRNFWKRIRNTGLSLPGHIVTGDSHLYAFLYAPLRCKLVLNFDYHHDCWGLRDSRIDTQNWMGQLLRRRRGLSGIWIGRHSIFPSPNKLTGLKLQKWTLGKFIKANLSIKIADPVFIAQSAAWTPPWADNAFNEFVNSSGCQILPNIENPPLLRNFRIQDVEEIERIKTMAMNLAVRR